MKPTKGNQMNDMQVRSYQTDGSAALEPADSRYLYFVPAAQEPVAEVRPARNAARERAAAFRHGMLVVVSSLLVVACVAGALATDLAARRSCVAAIDSAARQEVVVEGGDTVWGIAEPSSSSPTRSSGRTACPVPPSSPDRFSACPFWPDRRIRGQFPGFPVVPY